MAIKKHRKRKLRKHVAPKKRKRHLQKAVYSILDTTKGRIIPIPLIGLPFLGPPNEYFR